MPFTCAICFDQKPRATRSIGIPIANDAVCKVCFVDSVIPQLWTSIRDSSAGYPFKWGEVEVRFQDFAEVIPEYGRMLAAYEKKKDELLTPPGLRVYCPRDQTFLGMKVSPESRYPPYVCGTCWGMTCGKCLQTATAVSHKCRRDPANDALSGLQKGKDYQLCPDCSTAAYLESGCNAMRCVCMAEFCFLCGESVAHGDKEHCQPERGVCPRFGQPDDPNPVFDDEVDVVEEEEEQPPLADFVAGYRARAEAAVDQLFDLRTRFVAYHTEHLGETWEGTVKERGDVAADLHVAFSMLDLTDDGEVRLREEDLEVALERHHRILRFRDQLGWTLSETEDEWWREWLHQLKELWTWFAEHVTVEIDLDGRDEQRQEVSTYHYRLEAP